MGEGGQCISYGARCLNEGGLQAIPKLTFPGGLMTGCSAGFLNVPKIKGSHTAMKTGMLAGEEAAKHLLEQEDAADEVVSYQNAVENSWVLEELKIVRNVQPSFKYGLFGGLIYTFLSLLARGKEPWTFKWTKKDHEYTERADKHE